MTAVIPSKIGQGDKGEAREPGGVVHKAIEVLMGEHRLIEQALGSLETYGDAVRGGARAQREIVGDYARFFSGFTDACHHGKEEDILFQRMMERGFPREAGPLAVMFHEHELGRSHVHALSELGIGQGDVAQADAQRLLHHVEAYVPLLRQHITKEDVILYPMALQFLTGPELDAMNTQFEAFEARLRADGSHDRLRALAERLIGRFRPDAQRVSAAGLVACCGR
jgi:hemerythrin-like domain-containing protein